MPYWKFPVDAVFCVCLYPKSSLLFLRCRISSCCLVYLLSGRKPLYRPAFEPVRPLSQGRNSLDILYDRLHGLPGVSAEILVCPDDGQAAGAQEWAAGKKLKTAVFSAAEAREKPLRLRQERWALEGDRGHDDLSGTVLARIAEQERAALLIVIPVENLAIDRESLQASLELQFREDFDYLWSYDRLCGGNWMMLKAEMLQALQKHHPDIMEVKGGLIWALQKPLYPFRAGEYHCPRAAPALAADLRCIDERLPAVIGSDASESGPGGRHFRYEEWVNRKPWAEVFADQGPQVVRVEPTSQCGASCQACPHGTLNRPSGCMAQETWTSLVQGLGNTGCRWELSGMGEPFLHPKLGMMISDLRHVHATLVTSLQREIPTDFPFSALDQLSLSVDALEATRFQAIRAGCSWDLLVQFIDRFAEQKAKAPEDWPELGVTLMKHFGNADLDLSFLNYWKKVVTPVFRTDFFQWPLEEPPAKVQWFQIRGASDYLSRQTYPAKIRYTPMKRRACLHALLGMNVLWDGRVTICPFDVDGKWVVGDLTRQEPLEIWRSEQARAFRREHLNHSWSDKWPCASCQDWYHV